jgi:pilus assembly protein Flp/PilA
MKYQLKQLGQGMTEYIIIVALIAIAGIGAFTFFGDGLKQTIGSVTEELTGKDTTIVNSDKTDGRIKETRDMGDFNLSDK